jgi:cobalt/nickel transport system permease protein
MHIPDGYLSPQTSIPLIAAMVPIWGVALKKVKKVIDARQVPLLALCASFSFVIMMLNVPVVGGSSAHAVGAVFIAILLGPFPACIAVSTALFIQAVVFGDGGILAFGANCLNMAFIMPFTGYYIYKAIRGKAEIGSKRGLAALFIGSYTGLNLAALFASIEFGIQPLLFHTANGTPLYGIYPLSVSIPSMMFAHLLFAGPIEGIITVTAVAYLAKYAQHMFANENTVRLIPTGSFFPRYRAFIIPLTVLVVLTPLGLIAQGTAWGEWGSDEIKGMFGYIPAGFAKFADFWHALMPGYTVAPLEGSFLGSSVGYIISAVVGIALISSVLILSSLISRKISKGSEKVG